MRGNVQGTGLGVAEKGVWRVMVGKKGVGVVGNITATQKVGGRRNNQARYCSFWVAEMLA
jgi:hypothetical protein